MSLAAFALKKCTGSAAGTETTISGKALAFQSADVTTNVAADNPIPIPRDSGSSPAYSYELVMRWECTAAPDGYCQNFKYVGPANQPDFESSPANKVTVYAGTSGTGATPVNTQSTKATTAQHSNYYSEATGLAIGVVPGDSKIDAVGEKTNYLYLQLRVEYLAQGITLPTQVHFLYFDEV
ncbi:MAG: hypothetical protein WBP42_11570 [Candidatus Zixiibacteriota bacterium]